MKLYKEIMFELNINSRSILCYKCKIYIPNKDFEQHNNECDGSRRIN